MSALGAENTQLKATLETAQKASAAISEERDALKASAPTESTSAPLAEELERLRREKAALEQALQEDKSKPSVQVSIPNASDLEARLVRIRLTTGRSMFDSPSQAALTQERDQLLAEKSAWTKPPEVPTETKAVQENWEAEKAELVKNRDEAVTQAKVELTAAGHRNPLIFL
jgi:nucleoprotein TPR